MRTSTRRVVVFVAIGTFLLYVGWDLFSGIAAGGTRPSAPPDAIAAPAPVPTTTPSPVTDAAVVPPDAARVTYAIDISEISGLAPSAQPGTMLDLWVTWQRPLTKVPRLERLLRRVVLEQVAPPVTPEGPYVAILSLPQRHVGRLLWADRYGALSATVTPTP